MSFEDLVETYKKQISVGRVGQPADVAHTVSYLVSDGAALSPARSSTSRAAPCANQVQTC